MIQTNSLLVKNFLEPHIDGAETADFLMLGKEILEKDIWAVWEILKKQGIVVVDGQEVIGALTMEIVTGHVIRALLNTQAILTAVLDATEDAICIVDGEDRVTGWNKKAESLYSIKAPDILGEKIYKYFSNLIVTRVKNEDKEVRGEYHQPLPETHVLINAIPIRRGKHIIGGVAAEKNITEVIQLNNELTRASHQVRQLEEAIKKSDTVDPFRKLLGRHPRIKEVVALARRAAQTDATVLIRGESGTGKEILARAIHSAGNRGDKPFVVINCGAIPNALFESEVFGYMEGAFTGANRRGKPGMLELAHGGTLFLDEIGELTTDLQVKLLRALQEKNFYRVGGQKPVSVDVRVIAATNRRLEKMVYSGEFREDLYYRLNVISLELPPLRERQSDIPELIYHFLQEYCQLYGKDIGNIEPYVLATLIAYPWPGNVRELRNTVERLAVLAEGDTIDVQAVPGHMQNLAVRLKEGGGPQISPSIGAGQVEREIITRALSQSGGNRTAAAKMLNMPRSTLYYKLNRLGLLAQNRS